MAGSLGTFGIVLFTGLVLLYLVTSDSYGAPLLAPFSPLITRDLKDSVVKADILNLKMRPKFLQGQNKVRLAIKDEEEQED